MDYIHRKSKTELPFWQVFLFKIMTKKTVTLRFHPFRAFDFLLLAFS